VFSCVGWQVTLRDPIWHHVAVRGVPLTAILDPLTLNLLTLFSIITLVFLDVSCIKKQEPTMYGDVTKLTTFPFSLTQSPCNLLKLKPHKKQILKSSVTIFYYSTTRMSQPRNMEIMVQNKAACFYG